MITEAKAIIEKQIIRGDIFYIRPTKEHTQGSVVRNIDGRPAIIVSNNANNRHSNVVEVVYLTNRAKKGLPTHVKIGDETKNEQISTALCEQICSVSKEQLGDFVGHIQYDDMKKIDEALKISLGLKKWGSMNNEK